LRILVVLSRRPLVLLSHQLVVESPVVALPSCHAAILSSCLASHRPPVALAPPSHRLIAQVGFCCVASHCAALSSTHRPLTAPLPCHLIAPSGCCVVSRCAVVSSSCRPLTAPPSRRLITQAGCWVASCCAAVLSSHHATLSSSCHPLTPPPSCRLIAQAGCCLASRSAAGCPLVILSLRHPLAILCRLVAVLPLIAPPSCPLVVLPSRPLVAHPLVVAWRPSNAATAIERPPPPPPLNAIFIVHRRHRRCLRHRRHHLRCRTLHPRA
jgi:hypothetical protein